ncbi:MAG: hypothetical protein ACK5H2_00975 [Beutenbergiaceae bacterium]
MGLAARVLVVADRFDLISVKLGSAIPDDWTGSAATGYRFTVGRLQSRLAGLAASAREAAVITDTHEFELDAVRVMKTSAEMTSG